ncbi:DUF6233 domain-containing protein [Streptomyces eurythermus]|uniref:DUF6233 domain-containing protein n=1 Tax=Streptomyces eurythermus TaxID=42237 RepID=UPI0036A40E87
MHVGSPSERRWRGIRADHWGHRDAVPTEYMEQPSPVQKVLGPRRPSGWVLAKADARGASRGGVVHVVDCEEAPAGAPVLPLERALNPAEQPGVRLCSLCGAARRAVPRPRWLRARLRRAATSSARTALNTARAHGHSPPRIRERAPDRNGPGLACCSGCGCYSSNSRCSMSVKRISSSWPARRPPSWK